MSHPDGGGSSWAAADSSSAAPVSSSGVTLDGGGRQSAGDFASEGHLVDGRWHLTPEQAGRHQLLLATEREPGLLAECVQGELDDQRGIDDEHVVSALRASDGRRLLRLRSFVLMDVSSCAPT
jgi:hypothetical protein